MYACVCVWCLCVCVHTTCTPLFIPPVLWLVSENVLCHDDRLCGPSTGSLAALFHNLTRNRNQVKLSTRLPFTAPPHSLMPCHEYQPAARAGTRRREGGTTLSQEGPWDPLEGKRYGERLFWAQLVSACLALVCEGIYMQMLNNQLGG